MDVVSQENYTFKRLNPDLYLDLIYISKSAFNINPGIEYYTRKNKTDDFGPTHLGFIAYSKEGEPAAFYGVYAIPMEINGKHVLAAQSGDTMTHKNHMGKGLFVRLAKMTYELAKESGVDFIFGFPNNNSYPGLSGKLEWTCPYKLKEFRIKVRTIPLSKIAKKVKLFSPLYRLYSSIIFSLFSEKGESFPSSVIEAGIGGVRRTSNYMDYKTFNGAFLRKLDACSIWFNVDGFLFLGDVQRKENVDYPKMLKKIRQICFWAGIDVIIFQSSPGSFLTTQFSKYLTSTDAFYMGYLNLSKKYNPEDFKYVFGDVDTF